ncbi:hypothetical protein ACIBKY_24730 [Nonomuraea sp. NPDC050394]|uniref:hypothetical protein n=1 Tax=Nonomuraea sp. NPDC050394 TaxID=3364363 RepID=UPI0037989B15
MDAGAAVNDGDERADARHLPEFGHGWRRERVALGDGRAVLGLVHRATARKVVELSETSEPILISQAGLEVIDRIEEGWPESAPDAGELAVLADENFAIRHLLLSRLVAEGAPPAELFHILPWQLVSKVAEQIIATWTGRPPSREPRLRHWFTPAGSRFTAALEQLRAGQRTTNSGVVRVGATFLCAELLQVEVPRLPRGTRDALARLMLELAERDPFLSYWSRRAARRLRRTDEAEDSVHLRTTMQPAAETRAGIRRSTSHLRRDPFAIDVTITSTGRLEISVATRLPARSAALVADDYRVMVAGVEVRTNDGELGYVIPLRPLPDRLAGAISLRAPANAFEVGAAKPPIGAAEVRFLTEDVLRRSLAGVTTRTALRPWQELAGLLPADHRLRDMVSAMTGGAR